MTPVSIGWSWRRWPPISEQLAHRWPVVLRRWSWCASKSERSMNVPLCRPLDHGWGLTSAHQRCPSSGRPVLASPGSWRPIMLKLGHCLAPLSGVKPRLFLNSVVCYVCTLCVNESPELLFPQGFVLARKILRRNRRALAGGQFYCVTSLTVTPRYPAGILSVHLDTLSVS